MQIRDPWSLVAGVVLIALSFIPTRKSQPEIPAPNNSGEAKSVPESRASDPPPSEVPE